MFFRACCISFLVLFALAGSPEAHSSSPQSTQQAKKGAPKKPAAKAVSKRNTVSKAAAKPAQKRIVQKKVRSVVRKSFGTNKKNVKYKTRASGVRSLAAPKNSVTYRRRGPSFAQLMGLRGSADPLGLSATAVLAYDMENNRVLYEKNADQALPIASISKLMTALVIMESGVPLSEKFEVTGDDFVPSSNRSKLRRGMVISRKQAMHLALMSSDNRAAHFLARTYPGGVSNFIKEMNIKAALLGMSDTVFYDSIGLNNGNRSSAIDLSHLIAAAAEYEMIKELSTTPEASFTVGRKELVSRTTNSFVRDDMWEVGLQKTGLTTAAGFCMVMQTVINGHDIAMIFLDAPNKNARTHDAQRLKDWLQDKKLIAQTNAVS